MIIIAFGFKPDKMIIKKNLTIYSHDDFENIFIITSINKKCQ